MTIPLLGITPNQIIIEGQYEKSRINFKGQLQSGKGRAQIEGQYIPDPAVLTLTAKGSQLTAVDLPEYKVILTADVILRFAQKNLSLTGQLLIPAADIAPQKFTSTVNLPEEVVFAHEKKSANTLPFSTTMDLAIILGEKIHLVYHELKANLNGQVHLVQTKGRKIPTAVGELYATQGEYKAYGQTLKIQMDG